MSTEDQSFMNTIADRTQVVKHFLASKKKLEALKVSLAEPPVLSKSQSVKDANAAVIMSVMNILVDADIAGLVAGVDENESDVLMKYLYKFMNDGMQQQNYALVLKLHAALVKSFGVGSIVRVMSDRKAV